MNKQPPSLAFGPVPSRRLGQSLGINNIFAKHCSYSCVYCQLGRTNKLTTTRRSYYTSQQILESVEAKITQADLNKEHIDYLAFVCDGEPTLDKNLGESIQLLKDHFSIPVAVITNGSLLFQPDVCKDLFLADYVSVKVDSVNSSVWKMVDRPYGKLEHDKILKGILDFSAEYTGKLVTETMLLNKLNTKKEDAELLGGFLKKIAPFCCYLSIPTRPPAEEIVVSATEDELLYFYNTLDSFNLHVEFLTAYEGNSFASTSDAENDLLSIASVHPLRTDAVEKLLKKTGEDWTLVAQLLSDCKLKKISYCGQDYYLTVIN